ncbi:repressor phrH2 [Halarchaeum nitratireducens]|uniref:Uncharacterized protein n=1 Tax=Halarchaeum nitratireducens TaxID=489913 RepID=A0A830GBU8_9EURY|nr:repressor phrH2 [Halarchaeum nitratireducens]GGN18576.1 hypothetical protein GCM10009021_19470 [Halarchaeum nitratireducens]
MRREGDWMHRLDEALLEYLAEHDGRDDADDGGIAPGEIARTIRYPLSPYLARQRLRVLSQAGYAAPSSRDYVTYHITVWGRLYLDGDVRADLHIPRPDPRRPGHVLG